MGNPVDWLGGLLGGLGTGVGAALGGLPFDLFNYFNQQKQYEWQQDMVGESWAREDNAAQRRKADLLAAGLSPTLAAGGAAATSQAPQINAPQIDKPAIAQSALQGAKMGLDLLVQKQQVENLKSQQNKTDAETELVNQTLTLNPKKYDIQYRLANSGISLQDMTTAMKRHDLTIFNQLGIPTSSSGQIQQLINAVLALTKNREGILNTTGDAAKSIGERLFQPFGILKYFDRNEKPEPPSKLDTFVDSLIDQIPTRNTTEPRGYGGR